MLIIYYAPKASHSGIDSDWLYGVDLIWELLDQQHKYSLVPLNGFSRMELKGIFKSSDCLIRPTRHDGYSFSVQEALHYGLPVLHTYPIPGVILIKPEIEDIEEKLIELEKR